MIWYLVLLLGCYLRTRCLCILKVDILTLYVTRKVFEIIDKLFAATVNASQKFLKFAQKWNMPQDEIRFLNKA